MAKTIKVERKHFIECGEELPAFLITVDTEIPSDSDVNEVLDAIVSENKFDFVFCPQEISTYEALKASNTFHSEEDIPKISTWDRSDYGEGVCKVAEFLLNSVGPKFIVAGIESVFVSSKGTWLVSFWCINSLRATEWHFG